MGVLLMRTQGHGDCCLWERRDTMQEDYGTTLLIHQQDYTKTDRRTIIQAVIPISFLEKVILVPQSL